LQSALDQLPSPIKTQSFPANLAKMSPQATRNAHHYPSGGFVVIAACVAQ
jgi:hypothetical protein